MHLPCGPVMVVVSAAVAVQPAGTVAVPSKKMREAPPSSSQRRTDQAQRYREALHPLLDGAQEVERNEIQLPINHLVKSVSMWPVEHTERHEGFFFSDSYDKLHQVTPLRNG